MDYERTSRDFARPDRFWMRARALANLSSRGSSRRHAIIDDQSSNYSRIKTRLLKVSPSISNSKSIRVLQATEPLRGTKPCAVAVCLRRTIGVWRSFCALQTSLQH